MADVRIIDENNIDELKKESFSSLSKLKDLKEIDSLKKLYLTEKNSIIPKIINWISTLEKREEKVKFGRIVNEWRKNLIEKIESLIIEKSFNEIREKSRINLLLEGKKINIAYPHPIRKMIYDIYDFFVSQGYQIYEGPEIDKEIYNFDKLNMPLDHPARSSQDTFYLKGIPSLLLRTHTSNCQARVMEENRNKEIKIVSAGKVYRRDDDDATHSHQYTNLEVIVVGKNINLMNLKGTLESFFKWVFNENVRIRLRPSFFPFTEPSFEVDCSCVVCDGNDKHCSVCKSTGWIEILGAGLIHPNVLKNSGYDTKKFTGFALGMGVERILMIKYGIKDIRDFYLNDLRFLKQTKWA